MLSTASDDKRLNRRGGPCASRKHRRESDRHASCYSSSFMKRRDSAWLLGGTLVCVLANCNGGPPSPPTTSPFAHRNVMVIDEGIDLSSPDLQGHVIAAFSAVCHTETPNDGGESVSSDGGADADGGAPSFDELKRNYIARLSVPSTSCSLEPGISPKDDPLAEIETFRGRWNGMVRGQKFRNQVFSEDEWNHITGVMDPVLAPFPFHGTSTSSTVAHDNPNVRLVLIERVLQDPTTQVHDYVCATQVELDQSVALLSDPDVKAAYIHAPSSHYSDQFSGVIDQFKVGIINVSYGPPSRHGLELLQQMKGCAPADFSAYFTALHDVHVAFDAAAPPKPYLVVQSAGNESQVIESAADSQDCVPEDAHLLLVGSTALTGAPSLFSNVGPCINVTAPGEQVIAPYAGEWLLVDQGTSFSAPLITRFLSLTSPKPFDPVAARAGLLATLPAHALTFSAVPRDFFYAPAGATATATSALTVGGPRAPAEATRARLLRELAHADFDPILAPLRALRAALR